jgi:hypothetical protein
MAASVDVASVTWKASRTYAPVLIVSDLLLDICNKKWPNLCRGNLAVFAIQICEMNPNMGI